MTVRAAMAGVLACVAASALVAGCGSTVENPAPPASGTNTGGEHSRGTEAEEEAVGEALQGAIDARSFTWTGTLTAGSAAIPITGRYSADAGLTTIAGDPAVPAPGAADGDVPAPQGAAGWLDGGEFLLGADTTLARSQALRDQVAQAAAQRGQDITVPDDVWIRPQGDKVSAVRSGVRLVAGARSMFVMADAGVTGIRTVGTEKIGELDTTHYVLDVDAAHAALGWVEKIGIPDAGVDPGTASGQEKAATADSLAQTGLIPTTVQLWIGADGAVVKAEWANGTDDPASAVHDEAQFADWNAPVDITVPGDDEILGG